METVHKKVDAVIVGAGAGGGIVAKQLATAGIKTVLLERGDWPDYNDSPNDELTSQRNHVIRALHGPDRRKFPRAVGDGKGGIRPSDPWKHDGSIIAACVGSGTVTYGAMGWRFHPQDFKLKSIYGTYGGNSSLEDWPISYDDVERFYDQAEYEIGVSGDMTNNPFAPPRKRPFPMPPFEYNWEDKTIVVPTMRRLGLHPYPIPMLRNSVPYNGRAACIRNHTCCGFMCPCNAKNGTQNTVIPVALKTGNCELRTKSWAFEVTMDGSRATGVKYFDEQKNVHIQPADIVVVAASATETARLLFLSKSPQFPDGLGNQNDVLGRNIHSHIYAGAWGWFDHEVEREMGPGATCAISDFSHMPEKHLFTGILATEFYKLPWARTKVLPPGTPKWGAENKKFFRDNYRNFIRLIGPIQQVPTWEGRVILEPAVRDYFGLPVFRCIGKNHPQGNVQAKFLAEKADMILKEMGAKTTWLEGQNTYPGGAGGGQHQAGSCRMGTDPKKSVVDPNCKVWGTDNVFIGDGSVHVTNGGFNPVLTIMALAFRTGEHIAKTFSKA